MIYTVLPQQLLDSTTIDSIQENLEHLRSMIKIEHVVMGLLTREGRWRFPDSLGISPMKTTEVECGIGLLGRALELERALIYPDDRPEAEAFFSVGANQTWFEVTAPITYQGIPIGGLICDVFEKENRPKIANDKLREEIMACCRKISELFDNHALGEKALRRRIKAIVSKCITETSSKRGYLALKKVGGELEYFDEDKTFLPLSGNQGLCGVAFRTGCIQNVPDVWAKAEYVASDKEIRSELVVPIKYASETVAVLNMESTNREHFGKFPASLSWEGQIAQKAADELSDAVQKFRSLGVADSPISDVVQELLQYDGPLEVEHFAGFFGSRLSAALGGERTAVWLLTNQTKPMEFDGVDPYRPQAGVHQLSEFAYNAHAPIRINGRDEAVVGVIAQTRPTSSVQSTIKQTCRIAGEVWAMKAQERNATQMEKIVAKFLEEPTSVTLYEGLIAFQNVIGADSCTIYGRLGYPPDDVLAVAASTSLEIFDHRHRHGEMYYRIGKLVSGFYDGFTGYVATEHRPFHTANRSDMSEEEEKKWRQLGVRWKWGMAEGRSENEAAFICYPICTVDDHLIGVIRLTRTKERGNYGDFDQISLNRIKLIAQILGRAYATSGFFGYSGLGVGR